MPDSIVISRDADEASAGEAQRAPPLADAGSLRELLRVALPLMISSGSLSLMHVVDRMFLTWSSVDEMAASMPAGVLYWTVLSFPFGIAVYTNTFVAQYTGAARKDRVTASIWQGLYLAAVCGVLMVCAAPLAGLLFTAVGHREQIIALESDYFAILCLGSPLALLAAVFSAFFSGQGRTLVVMYVHIAVSLLNGVLDYALIFGAGAIPAMGIHGAAWATNAANGVSCAAFACLLVAAARSERFPLWSTWRFDPGLFLRILRYGLPTGVQYLVDVGAFLMFVTFVGSLGTAQLAATTLAFNLNSLAFVPMFGLGTAVMTLVGRRIGEQRADLAAQTTRRAFGLSAVYMGVFIALYLGAPRWLLAPFAYGGSFTDFEQVVPLVVTLLRFVALFSFFDAMAIVYGSAIRGAGDTLFSLLWTLATGWCLMVLPTVAATRLAGGNILWCWAAATAYITVLGIGFYLRYRGGRWKEMSVIERA